MEVLRTRTPAIFIIMTALLLTGITAFAQRPNIQWMRGGFEYQGDAAPTPFYSSDGQYLLTYEFEGPSVKIFNVSNGLLLQTIIPNFTDWITGATLSTDSQFFAVSGTGASGPEVLIYSFPAGNLLYTLPTSFVPYTLSFSPDDSLLAIGSPSFQGGYFTIANGLFTPATVLFYGNPVALTGSPQFMLGGLAFTYAQEVPSVVYPGLWTGPVTFPWSNWSDWPGYITSPLSSVGPYIAGNNGVVYALDSYCPEPGTQCDPPPLPAFAPSNTTSPGNSQNSSALSPDGSYLAVAANNTSNYAWIATLQTFATGTWTPGPSIALPTLAAGQIGLSPDSTAIALGNPMIQILNARDLSVQSTIAYDWYLVSSVAYSPDGTFVVSGDLDGQAIAWNTADGSLRYLLQSAVPGSLTQVDSVSIAPNGQLIAVGVNGTATNRGSINVYSASTGVLQISIPVATNGSYLSIAFLNDSDIVATASSGGAYIVIYSVTTGKPVKSVADPCEGSPAGLTAFPNGQSIAASCYDDAVIVNISTGKFTTLAEPVDTAILAIAVSPNSKYVAVGLNNYSDPPSVGRVQLFSAATGNLVDTYVGSNSSVFSVAFSSDSETIAAGSANGFLNFWSISSPGAPEQTYNQETGDSNTAVDAPNVSAIAYSADNEHVYYGRNDASSVLIDNPVYFPIASLALSQSSVIGGASVAGTATLTVPAPSYGAKIILSSSDSAAAEVPASITIPSGQTSGRFAITTTAQTAPTTVTIRANSTGTVQTASLTVLPQPALTAITLSPTSVTGGGSTTNNTVTLSSAAPTGGVRATLASSDPVAKPPASVVVPAGATVSPAFTITTHRVSAETDVTISATYDGITQQATLTVK